MFKIDIEDVINYSHCPMFQKYSSKDEFKDCKANTLEKYNKDLHTSIYNYNELKMIGEKPTLRQLNQVFITLWIGNNKTTKDILFVEPSSWRDTHEQRRKKGLNSLYELNKFFNSIDYKPVLINHKYEINITKNIILTGNIELTRDLKGSTELLSFKVDDKINNKTYIEKDLKITADTLAFYKMYNKMPDMITFYGLDKSKAYSTTRNEFDFEILKNAVKNISLCIKNNIYFPSIGDKCYSCLYKKICLTGLNDM